MIPSFTIGADHPSLAGHFPGRPVVPGVVVLDRVIQAALEAHPGHRAVGLPAVKYLRPVLPGDLVDVTCGPVADGRLGFVCRVGQAEVARGTLSLARRP